jgi:hypothetical protein
MSRSSNNLFAAQMGSGVQLPKQQAKVPRARGRENGAEARKKPPPVRTGRDCSVLGGKATKESDDKERKQVIFTSTIFSELERGKSVKQRVKLLVQVIPRVLC